jgi:xanthine dehydrogenase YagR molybdenum-binding subunit
MPTIEQKETKPANPAEGAKEESKPVKKNAQQTAQSSVAKGKRQEKLTAGIPGAEAANAKLAEVTRSVPSDAPPPLPVNSDLQVIGKPTNRIDGRAKVTGQAKYTADVQLPGILHAALLTAPVPHARIKSLDTKAAESAPGVKGVHVVEHVLDIAQLKDKSKEASNKYPTIRFAGQPVAAVAATSYAAAVEAARKIKVDYEPLPFVIDADEARKPDAPTVYPGVATQGESAGGGGGGEDVPQKGNVRGPEIGPEGKGKGDAKSALASAHAKSEAEYRTQVQTHSALETHGVVADWKPDMLTVWASTQSTSSVRDEMAALFHLPKTKVRVITEYMGGGFGAKFGASNPGAIAAALSQKTGAPVRLMLQRKEEHALGGNRPDSVQHVRAAADENGKLAALLMTGYGTAGAATGAGTGGPVQNMYDCPNILTEESDVFINAGPGTSFRAPGHPQGCFALEQAIDELAEKLGMDPLELRDKNDSHPARREERRIGAQLVNWSQRRKAGSDSGPVKRGLGVAQSVWYRINSMDSACEVRIGRDGSVELLSAVQDIGGGIRTALAQVVAEELGLRPEDIHVRIGDTHFPPGPPSGGSMTTSSITPAARNAAHEAKQQLVEVVAVALGTKPEDVLLRDGKVRARDGHGKTLTFKQAAAHIKTDEIAARAKRVPDYAKAHVTLGGVQFASVAVDTETGIVKVEKVTAVHDCGRPINPLALESQINGGVIQGLSFALYENRILDRNTGIPVNPDLEFYKVAGPREIPEIQIHIIEDYLALSSTDASGIGEPSTIPTSAAIANAFYNATGVRIRRLPMTPANVLDALQASQQKGVTA